MHDIGSKLGSFKSNRFNNLFESAAALLYHREDIVQFFTMYKEPTNLKQRSVFLDMQSPEILTMVAALAVCFEFVTGPFWKLVRSNIHYLDQGLYIQQMFANINSAKDYESVTEMLARCPTSLNGFGLPPNEVSDRLLRFLHSMPDALASIMSDCMKDVMEEFSRTTQKQLYQFLAGGIYSTPATPEQRQRLSHCQLNNLFGEACLGDLDFSLFKRRNGSVFHHSTVNMLKRNRSISNWLLKKPEATQALVLKFARAMAENVRETHRALEKAVVPARQEVVQELKMKKERLSSLRTKINWRQSGIFNNLRVDFGLT